ncbi:MAG TPA: alpha/beta hydrolase [Methylovirgula sp.]
MAENASKTVVFIHGAWMIPACWDNFRRSFQAAGYTTHAPAWPYLDSASSDELRRDPPPGLGALGITDIVDHYQTFIKAMPEKPLIIGYSFGGLFTQLLLDRGLGWAGVAIDPAPIAGVVPGAVSLAAASPVLLRWQGWEQPFQLSREAFARSFANAAPPDIQNEAYDRLVVPAPGRIFYEDAFWIGTHVHPKRRTQPLLITAAEKDRTVTPFTAMGAFNLQKKSSAETDFKYFPGHSHFLIGEPGWEDVANYILRWVAHL